MAEGDFSAPGRDLPDTIFPTVQSGHGGAMSDAVDDDDFGVFPILADDQEEQTYNTTIAAWIEALFHEDDGEKKEETDEGDFGEEGELEDDETAAARRPTEALSFSLGQEFTTIIEEGRREFSSAEPNMQWLNSPMGNKADSIERLSEHCTASQDQAEYIFPTVQSWNDAVDDAVVQTYIDAITDDVDDDDYIFPLITDDTVESYNDAITDVIDDKDDNFESVIFDNDYDTEERKDNETTASSWIDALFSDEDEEEENEETEKGEKNFEDKGEADKDETAAEFDIVEAAWNEAAMFAAEDELESEQNVEEEEEEEEEEMEEEEVSKTDENGQEDKTAMSRKETGAERLPTSGSKTAPSLQEERGELSPAGPNTRPLDPKRPHQCKTCNMSFEYSCRLENHQVVHTKVKAFVCHTCGHKFSQKPGLKQHIKLFHLQAKSHQCHACDKLFRTERALRVHTIVHTGEKPFKCTFCTQTFANMYQQKIHVDGNHLANQGRAHKCTMCHKSFYARAHLTDHIRVHTGEKPFVCPTCPKAFKQNIALQRHIDVMHKDNKVYKCLQCNKSFYRKERLDIHWNSHIGEKPYACILCTNTYADKTGLSKHMKRVH